MLEATAQVLVRDGYASLTTTSVAERAGVSVGTLYQYFPGKQALIAALAEQTLERMRVALAAAVAVPGTLEQQLERLVVALLAAKGEFPELSMVLPAAYHEVAGREALRDTLSEIETLVFDVLRQGGARGTEDDLKQ
ncbi:MAG: TetR/AcrR family transcriptional regulator, partial [Pseudomonadota bacterium]